jgi:hypothetical protein
LKINLNEHPIVIKTVFRERDGPFYRTSAKRRKQLSYF